MTTRPTRPPAYNTEDRPSLEQRIIVGLLLVIVALLLWNLSLSRVDAAPLERTCYVYPVTLRHVSCFAGWCTAYETVHVNGRSTLTVRVSGWKLRNGQIRLVEVCR